MAGEWLKLECATPDKPEVFAITMTDFWEPLRVVARPKSARSGRP